METEKENKPKKEKKKAVQKVFFCKGSIEKRKRLLKFYKGDFVVTSTNRTTKIKTDGLSYVYGAGAGFNFKDLNLFRELKTHALTNIKERQLVFPEKEFNNVNNFKFSKQLIDFEAGLTLDNCVAFDINKAYYRTAFNIGLIDTAFYNRCINLPKRLRLALIGSIATKKMVTTYKGGKVVNFEIKTADKVLRHAWFNIVEYVDNCLKDLAQMCGDRFLFYWVDGIYLIGNEEDFSDIVAEISRKYDLEFKTEGVERIEIVNDSRGSKIANIYKTELIGKPVEYKPFYLTKQK